MSATTDDLAMSVVIRFVAFCEMHPEVLDIHEAIRYVFGDAVDLIAGQPEHAEMLRMGFTGVHGWYRCEQCGHDQEIDTRPSELSVKQIAAEKQLREDALMVLTVYDDRVAAEDRGPWRDRLMAWAAEGPQPEATL